MLLWIHYNLQDTSQGPYPVMVWFHGGGYTGSGNVQYPGHFIAGHDVVMVVPNYRLGAFGEFPMCFVFCFILFGRCTYLQESEYILFLGWRLGLQFKNAIQLSAHMNIILVHLFFCP